jgi:hypothetical protein
LERPCQGKTFTDRDFGGGVNINSLMKIPTFKENPEFWNNQAKRPLYAFLLKMSEKKCPFCKTRFKEGLITDKNEIFKHEAMFDPQTRQVYFISGMAMFHIKETHGYPPELMMGILGCEEFNEFTKNKL